MDEVVKFFLNRGVEGVIIVVLGSVIVWQETRNARKDVMIQNLSDKRVADLVQIKDFTYNQLEKMANAQSDSLTKLADIAHTTLTVVQNLQSIMNSRK